VNIAYITCLKRNQHNAQLSFGGCEPSDVPEMEAIKEAGHRQTHSLSGDVWWKHSSCMSLRYCGAPPLLSPPQSLKGMVVVFSPTLLGTSLNRTLNTVPFHSIRCMV
jgi:hypothetical protein